MHMLLLEGTPISPGYASGTSVVYDYEIERRLTRHLAGSLPRIKPQLPPGSVLVTRELLPSETIELVNSGVVAVVKALPPSPAASPVQPLELPCR